MVKNSGSQFFPLKYFITRSVPPEPSEYTPPHVPYIWYRASFVLSPIPTFPGKLNQGVPKLGGQAERQMSSNPRCIPGRNCS